MTSHRIRGASLPHISGLSSRVPWGSRPTTRHPITLKPTAWSRGSTGSSRNVLWHVGALRPGWIISLWFSWASGRRLERIRTSVRRSWPSAPLCVCRARCSCPRILPCPQDSSSDFASQLRSTFAALRPTSPAHHQRVGHHRAGVPDALMSAPFVFVRVDAVRPPLARPYSGPYKVLAPGSKTFTVCRAGKPWTVSADRLKPAFGFSDPAPPAVQHSTVPAVSPPLNPSPGPTPGRRGPVTPATPKSEVRGPDPATPSYSTMAAKNVTRFGRVVRVPDRFLT